MKKYLVDTHSVHKGLVLLLLFFFAFFAMFAACEKKKEEKSVQAAPEEQQELRISKQYGVNYLPLIVLEGRKLIEKNAKEAKNSNNITSPLRTECVSK
jgi:ABC-type nitrate/sulfonate/bicarbonate transport system substrate-binding protein